MSMISIGIQGSNASYSIDVEKMRDRLDMMQRALTREIDARGGEAPELQKRLDKVQSQIDRLDRLDGKDVTVSPQYAKQQLEQGMKLLSEGAQFLKNNSDGHTGAMQKLEQWFDHLSGVYRQVDTRA